ncbi:hypothetical protein ABZX39_33545 [Streptomyces collinus]|uniref:type IV secretory system conjugative DNA transfer family protein n=1 Tax=Streptomyces collinus TaxID=42684 RepID=UPI0033A78CD2
MTANTTTTTRGPHTTERRIATATSLAPIAVGVLAPLLGTDAATAVDLTALASWGLSTANVMDAIPDRLYNVLPAGDVLRGYRVPNFIAHTTTAVALGMGTLAGPQGTEALLGGITQIATAPVPGIVSLGWWAATLLVPYQLRRVLGLGRRRRASPATDPALPAPPGMPPIPATEADQIHYRWAQYISNPNTGSHPQQILTVTHLTPGQQWTGVIDAPTGKSVTVTEDSISSLEGVPTAWIDIQPGAHAGQRTITVNLQPPAELDTSTLAGAWRKWVARTGGVMAGTHLEDIQTDPNTGGEVAYVVAGDTLDKLPIPDRASLAGALRTNTLLCSYNPVPGDPRRGEVRKMQHNPLQDGVPFPGTNVLKISKGGYVQIGRHVSGFPARIQFTDPVLGARHLFIAGVTGSGKGGLIQIVALADHTNGHAIIYGDPKGSSNPDVETMACHPGLGEDGVMGSLRVAYALMQWRIEESARLRMKNFVATPDRPWVRVLLDEAHVPLSELVQHKKEAAIIVEALAAKARSLGIILGIVNQAVNAEKLGGSTALRMNVIQGGSLVMLRSDSGQQHLVTTGFEGVDPGDIPAAWDVERPLVYDETVGMKDPKSTFGIGYVLGPGGAAEMMRTFHLESAAPYIDHDAIAYPADWPDWDAREEIAATSVLGDGEAEDGGPGALFAGIELTKKPETAEDKILRSLEGAADPAGLEATYLHKDDIAQITGLKGSTLNNALTALTKDGQIHRGPDRGTYGLGPASDAGE